MNECRKSIPTLELLQESPIPSMPIKGHPPEYEHMQSALKRRKALSFQLNQYISKFSNISTRVNAEMKINNLKTQPQKRHLGQSNFSKGLTKLAILPDCKGPWLLFLALPPCQKLGLILVKKWFEN
jgi:hypothetical protein